MAPQRRSGAGQSRGAAAGARALQGTKKAAQSRSLGIACGVCAGPAALDQLPHTRQVFGGMLQSTRASHRTLQAELTRWHQKRRETLAEDSPEDLQLSVCQILGPETRVECIGGAAFWRTPSFSSFEVYNSQQPASFRRTAVRRKALRKMSRPQ